VPGYVPLRILPEKRQRGPVRGVGTEGNREGTENNNIPRQRYATERGRYLRGEKKSHRSTAGGLKKKARTIIDLKNYVSEGEEGGWNAGKGEELISKKEFLWSGRAQMKTG